MRCVDRARTASWICVRAAADRGPGYSTRSPTGADHAVHDGFYPNARTLCRTAGGAVTAWKKSVDARHVPRNCAVPDDLFLLSSLRSRAARAMLADAFEQRQGIGIFEGATRGAWTMLAVTACSLSSDFGKQFGHDRFAGIAFFGAAWSRWFRRCCGSTGCCRVCGATRSLDLRELTAGLSAPDYEWQIGDERGGRVPIRYLIGTPTGRR